MSGMQYQQQPGQQEYQQSTGRQTGSPLQQGSAAGQQGGFGHQGQVAGQQFGGGLESQQYPTRNYLPEGIRTASIQRLNRCLADTTVLMTQAKYAHWNVKGMQFIGLHELFDELAETLEDHVDTIAERATALGGEALGTARMAVQSTTVPPVQRGAVSGPQLVESMAECLAVHDANLSQDIEAAEGSGDVDTADLLNEVSRDVSKYLWFLEAHLQDTPAVAGQGEQGGTGQLGSGQQFGGQGTGGQQFGSQ